MLPKSSCNKIIIYLVIFCSFISGLLLSNYVTQQQILRGDISAKKAREYLPYILDASNIPYGDIAFPSQNAHSKRYIISQWQRVATGAAVVVLSETLGELYVALGVQKGKLRIPQGYMESQLPNEDLTGLRLKNASRVNGKTGELVMTDTTLEDTAEREVWEEIGLRVSKNSLKLLRISSHKNDNPIIHTIAAYYGVKIHGTPTLRTIDKEFSEDDLSNPKWHKLSDIQKINNLYYIKGSNIPIENLSMLAIKKATQLFAQKEKK